MIKNKIRSLNFCAYIVLASIIFSLAMSSTCLATSPDLKSKFNDNEYQIQLHNMVNDINKIKDDIKNGKISQEKANGVISSLIDDPRYNQVKMKKQIVEQEYGNEINTKSELIPNSEASKNLKFGPDSTSSIASSTASSTTYSYYYTTLSSISGAKGGWGVGYNVATSDLAGKSLKAASRSEAAGSYYAYGHFNRYFYAPRSGNAVARADIQWTGGCFYPDVCTVDFILYRYDQDRDGLKLILTTLLA